MYLITKTHSIEGTGRSSRRRTKKDWTQVLDGGERANFWSTVSCMVGLGEAGKASFSHGFTTLKASFQTKIPFFPLLIIMHKPDINLKGLVRKLEIGSQVWVVVCQELDRLRLGIKSWMVGNFFCWYEIEILKWVTGLKVENFTSILPTPFGLGSFRSFSVWNLGRWFFFYDFFMGPLIGHQTLQKSIYLWDGKSRNGDVLGQKWVIGN